MGPRFWGLPRPAFGVNGLVEGSIKFDRRCTHVVRLSVTLLGKLKVTSTVRGMIADMNEQIIVNDTVDLPPPASSECGCYQTEQLYSFSLPFPTLVKGSASPLPPSFSAWSPGVSTEITYVVKIDVYRKGFRPHNGRTIPITYLPKTWPSQPPFRGDIMLYQGLRTARLQARWPCGANVASDSTAPTIEIALPPDPSFASGTRLPFKLTIACTGAPAHAKLLAGRAEVHLMRRTQVLLGGMRVLGSRDSDVARATLLETTQREGSSVELYELMLGELGKEQSWMMKDAVAVTYFLTVRVCPPAGASKFLPEYADQVPVRIASEPWGTRERELLQFGGHPAPALGLSMARGELRPSQTVGW
ncbi:hypothetical protein EWM64_g6602 [Hericium alpestre]|uniref:Arrestin-like N-terminal domain-containing protein n=1 Tax=Hericium alpestre TaxID=135208 RepID=A0A4Y9ZU98_9AGAM|nr:hypothetical protein EWM64_g6602 [Hericium alpestre]